MGGGEGCEKRRGGEGVDLQERVCQISANSEQLRKSLQNSHMGPACTEPFNYEYEAFLCERIRAECVNMKSSVTEHYGCN